MFTQCAHCDSRFEIDIAQLKSASGVVSCGQCKKEFNALDTLHDEKIDDAISKIDVEKNVPQLNEKAQPLITHGLNEELIASADADMPELLDMKLDVDTSFDESNDLLKLFPKQEVEKQQKNSEEAPVLIEGAFSMLESSAAPKSETIKSNKTKDEKEKSIEEFEISEALLEKVTEENNIGELSSRKSGINTLGWSVAILLMIALLAFQYIYVARDQLAEEHDGLRAPLEAMCSVVGCSIPLKKSVDQIQLLHKSVQGHTNVKNALVVSATYVNNAPFIQPYPTLELVLSDIKQQIVVNRQFSPDEYIVDKKVIEAGISPKVSTQVLLEIVDPGKDAVNFEFNFL